MLTGGGDYHRNGDLRDDEERMEGFDDSAFPVQRRSLNGSCGGARGGGGGTGPLGLRRASGGNAPGARSPGTSVVDVVRGAGGGGGGGGAAGSGALSATAVAAAALNWESTDPPRQSSPVLQASSSIAAATDGWGDDLEGGDGDGWGDDDGGWGDDDGWDAPASTSRT